MQHIHKSHFAIALVVSFALVTGCATTEKEWEHRPKYDTISRVSSIGTENGITVVGSEHGYFNNKQDLYSFVPGPHSIKVRFDSGTPKEVVISASTIANHFYIVEQMEGPTDREVTLYLKDYGINFPYYCVPAQILKREKQVSPSLLEQCINL
jgi:hypothetical protein